MVDSPESSATPDESDSSAFTIGDVVHDTDDTDPNDAIVVNLPSKTADEWIAYRETTVAEDNPAYPADARVIVVGYADELDETFPDWDRESHLPLDLINESSAGHYSFPAPRLIVVGSTESAIESSSRDEMDSAPGEASSAPMSEDEESDTVLDSETETTDSDDDVSESADAPATEADLSESMCALKDRLEEGGMSVEIEPDGEALSVRKLDDSYRVRPGAVIEGDGALQARLSSIVDEYG